MAIRHGRDVRLYINGYDLSGETNSISPTSEMDLVDITTFGDVGYSQYPGLAKDSITVDGLYNTNVRTVFDAMFGLTTGYDVMIMYGATSGGEAHACNEVMMKSNSVKSIVTDVNRISVSLDTVNYPFDDCIMLTDRIVTATTTAGTGTTSVNHGATSATTGGAGYLQVFDVGSSGTLTVTIQQSSTGAWAGEEVALISFTAASSSEAQRIAFASTGYQYTRSYYVVTASTSQFAVTIYGDNW